jgi:hypothetical protein
MKSGALFSTLAVAVCLLFAAAPGRAQSAFSIAAVRVATPPKLDGTLDDPVWKTGAHVQLGWNSTYLRAAAQTTDAYVLVDDKNLYVAYVAKQVEPLTATVHTNDVGLGTDDIVRTFLFPSGDRGFEYFFAANPIGTRYANSSENAAYSPAWDAVTTRTSDGYIVTERIPLAIMRGDGRSTWRIQFDRRIVANNSEQLEWAHDPAQRGDDDVVYTGYLTGMRGGTAGTKPKARANLYALGALAAPSVGGSTSRVGMDLAVPVTATASFLATFHPDYSNVELDQQSISPTAFARQFQEVRPFFTQGATFYNNFNCNDCAGFPLLYTPNIPTPRDGFAIEGTQGPIRFGAFDSLANGRTDTSQAVAYRSNDHRKNLLYQRSTVDLPGLHDVAEYGQFQFGNAHNFSVYVTQGRERGSLVATPSEGNYAEYGINYYTPKQAVFAAYHDLGAQYSPIDSFTQINDIHGPSVYTYKEWDFDPKNFVTTMTLSQDYQHYHSRAGVVNDTYANTDLMISTNNKFQLMLSTGAQYLFFPGTPGDYANQNGIFVSYNGNSSTPTTFSYNVGRFGPGYLHSIARGTTLKMGPRATLSLEADDTIQNMDGGERFVQWLERASVGVQIDPRTSLAFGVRRIFGIGPYFVAPGSMPQPQTFTNLSAAFYKRFGPSEIYVVYGDPNQLRTRPAFIVKYILYVGAQKGT